MTREFLRSLPKAELHVHLEGSIEPDTLRELRPELTDEEIREHYSHDDFGAFLKNYVWVVGHLEKPEDYALITRRLLERLTEENVQYVEINLSAGVAVWKKLDLHKVFDAASAAARESSIRVRWIFDAVRQWGVHKARPIAEAAAERVGDGVVGFGIGGDEVRGPVELFQDLFAFARSKGLRIVPHAGEADGPESVWNAVRAGADRIGHGIRAVEDPELLRYLREHSIPLEVSISSNVATGSVPSLDAHPVRRIFDAGVPIVLNTDDPAMFHTTLTREFEIAACTFGFSEAELTEVAGNGFRFAFGLK
jgi:adenosine deaminase/aminodeoxyfutalosine deaminase